MLRGKLTDKVQQRHHERLSTFGIGSDLSEAQWRSVLRQLLALGHVHAEGDYNVLSLSDSARAVLRGEVPVVLREVDDRDLLDLTNDVVDLVITSAAIDGKTLREIGREQAARGVFLRRITRGGVPMAFLLDTVVHRGDVLTVVGSASRVARTIEHKQALLEARDD